MARHAKVLNDRQLVEFENWIKANSHNPVRDMALIQLSFRAGLRAGEMAKLRWTDVVDAEDEMNTDFIYLPSQIVKYQKRERTIPMHPKVRDALIALRSLKRNKVYVCNKIYERGASDEDPITDNALTVYLHRLYKAAGFEGGSSHSGRRTFITKLSRRANVHHCSLVDVQRLAGHADVRTTELYIEPSDDVSGLVLNEV